jgi:hypothetical protein
MEEERMSEKSSGWDSAPAPVAIAAVVGFGKAGVEGLLGLIAVITADEVGDGFGGLIIAYAVVFALASLLLLRGSRLALYTTVVLTVAGGVGALIYLFTGPAPARDSCLVALAINVLVLLLLIKPASSREYFTRT